MANFLLFIGVFCYVFVYPDKFVHIDLFLITFTPIKINLPPYLDISFFYALTSFCHVGFMSLYTFQFSRLSLASCCLFWGGFDTFFELMQHDFFSYEGFYFFMPEVFLEYFLNGTFDVYDIIAIWSGAMFSFFYIRVIYSRKRSEDSIDN